MLMRPKFADPCLKVPEYNFAVSAIVQNTMDHGLHLALTFLDLKNAFRSVSNMPINDTLAHVKLPQEICTYISNTYSKLSAYVATKNGLQSIFK